MGDWNFLTNYGLVLVAISKDAEKTAREIGSEIGLTERTVHKIIIDLEQAKYITRTKVGRNNIYRIHSDMEMKDPLTDASIGELLRVLCRKTRSHRKLDAIAL